MDPAGERPRRNNAMGSQLCMLFRFFQSGRNNRPNQRQLRRVSSPQFSRLSGGRSVEPVTLKNSSQVLNDRSARQWVGYRLWAHIPRCPVAAVMAYLAVRGDGEGPLFKFADGRCLTKERFTRRIREALAALGLRSADYAGHSFRIGAATTAAQVGL